MRIGDITEIGGKKCPRPIYKPVVIQSYFEVKSGKKSNIHACPISGQPEFPMELDVECCRTMRETHPIGTMFLVWGKINIREGKGKYVYTYEGWPYEIINK